MWWQGFCWGLLVGFLIEWLCDWIFWRKARPIEATASTNQFAASAASASNAVTSAGNLGAATIAAAALPPGIASYKDDDIEQIEGIGPKIAELFHAQGVTTFAGIAAMPLAKIQAMLDAAGPRFKLANPATWVEQASLAAKGDWLGFDKLKKELVAGVRKSAE